MMEESARRVRELSEEERLSKAKDLLSVNSEFPETADAARDTVLLDATEEVSTAPDGDGVVPPLFTRKPNKENSMEELVVLSVLLRESSSSDPNSHTNSRKAERLWLDGPESLCTGLENTELLGE